MVFGMFTGALAAETNTEEIALHSLPFNDVQARNWFYPYVDAMYSNDIMLGVSADRFSPQGTFSRAQVLATLFRIYHGRTASMSDSKNSSFSDVPSTSWAAPYVTWAVDNGITSTTSGAFGPNQAAVRQEIALFIHRYITNLTDISGSSVDNAQWNTFSDLDQIVGQDAYMALRWANNRGVVNGITRHGVSRIAPMNTATRAEAATMLARLLSDVTGWPQPQIVNIATLLDQSFDSVQHVFGHLIDTIPSMWDVTYRFRSGILVGVDESGRIVNLLVDFARARPSIQFHYNEIGRTSTRHDVRARLGAPTSSDGISYAYWLSGEILNGPVLTFTFDSQDNDRVTTILFSHPV